MPIKQIIVIIKAEKNIPPETKYFKFILSPNPPKKENKKKKKTI
jgi:hypothetical protein